MANVRTKVCAGKRKVVAVSPNRLPTYCTPAPIRKRAQARQVEVPVKFGPQHEMHGIIVSRPALAGERASIDIDFLAPADEFRVG